MRRANAAGNKNGKSKSSLASDRTFGIDPNSRILTDRELENELKNASMSMQSNREMVRGQLQTDLAADKEVLMNMPDDVANKISLIVRDQVNRMRGEINQGTNQLRENILQLRTRAIELDDERRKATEEMNGLRARLAKVQYEDDIRNTEIMQALADNNHAKILPSSSNQMPEPLLRDSPNIYANVSDYECCDSLKKPSPSYASYGDSLESCMATIQGKNVTSGSAYDADSCPCPLLGDDEYQIENIYNRNITRDHVFKESLEGRTGHFKLADYLERDLEECRREQEFETGWV